MFGQAAWAESNQIQDPELKELAEALPTLVLQCRATSTVKKYSGAFCHWKRWASTKSEVGCSLPPKPIHIVLYLSLFVQRSNTSAPILEAVNALSWVNQVATVEDTMTYP